MTTISRAPPRVLRARMGRVVRFQRMSPRAKKTRRNETRFKPRLTALCHMAPNMTIRVVFGKERTGWTCGFVGWCRRPRAPGKEPFFLVNGGQAGFGCPTTPTEGPRVAPSVSVAKRTNPREMSNRPSVSVVCGVSCHVRSPVAPSPSCRRLQSSKVDI